MAVQGTVVCWLDQSQDESLKQRAAIAIAQRFPGVNVTYSNPRFFTSSKEVGTRWPAVVGIALATTLPQVHQAYLSVTDKPVIKVLDPVDPVEALVPEVIVYLPPGASDDRRLAFRACAASSFPGATIKVLSPVGFKQAVGEHVAGVVCAEDQTSLIRAWKVRGVPVETLGVVDDLPVPTEASTGPDYEAAHAILALDEGAMRALVGEMGDLTFLLVLADLEERTLGRLWVHEILHARLTALESFNPHIEAVRQRGEPRERPRPAPGSPVDEGSTSVEGGNTPEQEAKSYGDRGAWLVGHSVRQVERKLGEEAFTVDELIAAKLAEENGERRSTVVRMIQRRLEALGQVNDPGDPQQHGA